MWQLVIIFVSIFFIVAPPVSAHPGRTASDGCHYCRTNCAKWGEVEGARHCHGTTQPTTPTRNQVAPTARPTIAPVRATALPVATLRPAATKVPVVACSAVVDSICSSSCTAGNDFDCCNKKPGYTWYHDWGCYPEEVGTCSATQDYKCSSQCTAGNDYDCCLRMDGYKWYDNWGCYPE